MELCKTDIYFIILLIFNLFLFYKFYELKNITKENVNEPFAVQDDVKAAINQVYQADVEAIRNLSAIATKLQAGGLTVAGALTVTGKLWTQGGTTGGGGQTHFPYDNGINYIRGQTQQDGDLNVRDQLGVGGSVNAHDFNARNELFAQNAVKTNGSVNGHDFNARGTVSGHDFKARGGLYVEGDVNGYDIFARRNMQANGTVTANGDINAGGIIRVGKWVINGNDENELAFTQDKGHQFNFYLNRISGHLNRWGPSASNSGKIAG